MDSLQPATRDFYVRSIDRLTAGGLPFLIGGGFASAIYTGISRHTKDLDFFVQRRNVPTALRLLAEAGYRTELRYPHWLGKAHLNDSAFVDIIFSCGNGLGSVDDEWFEHARPGTLFGRTVRYVPPEEMIWSKAFVMERERYDGADVAHLLLNCAEQMDWERLVRRFGEHWRVLYAHLVLFGFVYPGRLGTLPQSLLRDFGERVLNDYEQPSAGAGHCPGTLLSRAQYLSDVAAGLRDVRLDHMSAQDIALWTPSA